jgi:hypothetical protein
VDFTVKSNVVASPNCHSIIGLFILRFCGKCECRLCTKLTRHSSFLLLSVCLSSEQIVYTSTAIISRFCARHMQFSHLLVQISQSAMLFTHGCQ